MKSTEAIQTIKSNVFDDDMIERSLVNLRNLWKNYPKSRQLIQVEFGYIPDLLPGRFDTEGCGHGPRAGCPPTRVGAVGVPSRVWPRETQQNSHS